MRQLHSYLFISIFISVSWAQDYVPCVFTDQEVESPSRSLLVNCGGDYDAHISSQSLYKRIKFKVRHHPGLSGRVILESVIELRSNTPRTLGSVGKEKLTELLKNIDIPEELRSKLNHYSTKIYFEEIELHPQTPFFSAPPSSFDSEEDVFFEDSLAGIVSNEAQTNVFVLDYGTDQGLAPLLVTGENSTEELRLEVNCAPIPGDILIEFASFTADHFDLFFQENNEQRLDPQTMILLTLRLHDHKKLRKDALTETMVALAFCLTKTRKSYQEQIESKLWSKLSKTYENFDCNLGK